MSTLSYFADFNILPSTLDVLACLLPFGNVSSLGGMRIPTSLVQFFGDGTNAGEPLKRRMPQLWYMLTQLSQRLQPCSIRAVIFFEGCQEFWKIMGDQPTIVAFFTLNAPSVSLLPFPMSKSYPCGNWGCSDHSLLRSFLPLKWYWGMLGGLYQLPWRSEAVFASGSLTTEYSYFYWGYVLSSVPQKMEPCKHTLLSGQIICNINKVELYIEFVQLRNGNLSL